MTGKKPMVMRSRAPPTGDQQRRAVTPPPVRDRTDAGPTAGGGREGGDWPRRAAIGPVDPYLCGLLPDLNCGLLAQPATRGSKGMRPALFDHFVGAGEEGGRDREAEFSCGFQIDHQLDPGREKYGKIDRLFTLEDTACVYSGLAIPLLHTRPIAHKAANNGGCAGLVRGGDADLHGTADEQLAPAVQEGARSDQQGVRRRSSEGCECRVYFGVRVRMKQVDRQAKGDRPASTSAWKRRDGPKSELTSTAIFFDSGTSSCRRASRLPASSRERIATPVVFPSGLFRLVTKPRRTGSSPLRNTIGIVLVAACAEVIEGLLAKITSTRRDTRSAANAGRRV